MQIVLSRSDDYGGASSRVLYSVPSAHGSLVSWMHDVAVTQNHILLVENPLLYRLSVRPSRTPEYSRICVMCEWAA